MAAVEKPPKGELGHAFVNAVPSWAFLSGANFGRTTSVFIDDRETVDELRWPISVRDTFPRMATDSQLKALDRGTVLPITRYAWGIDANGADPKLVAAACADYNLPLIDDAVAERTTGRPAKPVGRARNRLSFSRHQTEVLKTIRNGHGFFEHVGAVGDDLKWHPRKLAELPPRTLEQIFVAEDGGLVGVKQTGIDSEALGVNRLVAYVWDPADRGDWVGTSMYRACYREWLIKDRLLRVDARNHEKGGGAWWGEAGPSATPKEKDLIAQAAADMNAISGPVPAMPNGAGSTSSGPAAASPRSTRSTATTRRWRGRGC
jgi:hypothetical protein